MSQSEKDLNHPHLRKSFEVPASIRGTMKFLEFVHWKLALYFALKLFFTPLKFSISKREHQTRNQAKRVRIPLENGHASLFEWGSGEDTVLIMHGWSGRASQFFRLIDKLVENGFHVYSVEGPAHGDSPDKKSNMLDFVKAIEWTQQNRGPINALIGHSLGGVAIFHAHRNLNGIFKKLITVGMPATIRGVIDDFCKAVNASTRVADGIVADIEKSFSVRISDASAVTLAKQWNPAGLIFHDELDTDVNIESAYELSAVWTNAELIVSKGLGHRRILSDPEIHNHILKELRS